jgi:hypothetical protein
MAKLTGPLFSLGASGSVAKTLVYARVFGVDYTRVHVVPKNPETASQGNVRQILGGLGRAARVIVSPSDWLSDADSVTPSGQSWVSSFIKRTLLAYMDNVTNYEAMVTELEAHTAFAAWTSHAATLGLSEVDVPYSGTTEAFTGALQLYMLAKYTFLLAGENPTLFDRAPYTTALASWTTTEIAAFIVDFQAVA